MNRVPPVSFPVPQEYLDRSLPGFDLEQAKQLPGVQHEALMDPLATAPPSQYGFFVIVGDRSKVFFFAVGTLMGQYVIDGDRIDPLDAPAFDPAYPRLAVAWIPASAKPYQTLLRWRVATRLPAGVAAPLVPSFPPPPLDTDCLPVLCYSHPCTVARYVGEGVKWNND